MRKKATHASRTTEHLPFVSVALGFHCGRWKARYVSELFGFLKFVMNFLKGAVSICHSFRNTGQPGRINGFHRCFQVVDRCTARRHRVTYSCAREDINCKVLSAPQRETKAANTYHCPNVCESCGQFIRTNLFKN